MAHVHRPRSSVARMARLMAATSARVAHEISLVLLPRGCAGCGKPDEVLCPDCRALFSGRVVRSMPAPLVASGRCVSCADYSGAVRHAILRWKDHGDAEVGSLFGRLLSQRAVPEVLGFLETSGASHRIPIRVVPAPSSPGSIARRGRFHAPEIARPVASALRGVGLDARYVEALRMRAGTRKSVQGSVRSRQSRAGSRIRLDEGRLLRAGGEVPPVIVLVDDICTTGSTLLGCARVLRVSGYRVICAVTLAAVEEGGEDEEEGWDLS